MRCKHCDAALKSSEIIWYEDEKRHEDLCGKCRNLISEDMRLSGWDDSHIPLEELGGTDGQDALE